MRKFALILLLTLAVQAASAAKKPDPAEYTITVHVVGSANRGQIQHLLATIDGKCMELQSVTGQYNGLLPLGDYKARLDDLSHKTGSKYDLWHVYQLYLPLDEKTRDYTEIAIGTPAASCAAGSIGGN